MVACGWVQHDQRLMWRQSDVLSGRPIHPRVLALGQSRLLTAMCWDCVRVAGGQPWLFWRAGSASITGIGTGLGDTLYCRPKFCAVFLCSAFCKLEAEAKRQAPQVGDADSHASMWPLELGIRTPTLLAWLSVVLSVYPTVQRCPTKSCWVWVNESPPPPPTTPKMVAHPSGSHIGRHRSPCELQYVTTLYARLAILVTKSGKYP